MTYSSVLADSQLDLFAEHVYSLARSIGVSRIAEITAYDEPLIYVFQSCRPGAYHLTVDSGKGYSRRQAFISCCVEAIERYSAENLVNSINYLNIRDLNMDIQSMLLLKSAHYVVPCISGLSLFAETGSTVYIPEEMIRYDLRMNARPHILLYRPGTTGLGSHSDLSLACYSGLIEILERDAIRSPHSKYRVDIDSLPSLFEKHIEWIRRRYKDFSVIYHQSPHPVHSFSIECNEEYLYGGLNGMGASYCITTALENAFMEAIQTSVMRISASRDDWVFATPPFGSRAWIGERPVLKWEELTSKLANIYGSDPETHLESIRDYCCRNNYSVYYCSLLPEIETPGLVTVKVVCPWLQCLEQGSMLTGVPRFIASLEDLSCD